MSQICRYYGTIRGCRNGWNCYYIHDQNATYKSDDFCKDFNSSSGCMHGNRCYYRHMIRDNNSYQLNPQIQYGQRSQRSQPMIKTGKNMKQLDIEMNEYLICGYIRSCTQQNRYLSKDYMHVIQRTIMIFYGKSFWNFNSSHRNMIINNNTGIITNNSLAYETLSAFSTNCISKGRIKCSMQIIKKTGEILIGIIENPYAFIMTGKKKNEANEKFWRLPNAYGYFNRGYINKQKGNKYDYEHKRYAISYWANDIITIHLNMDLNELSFSVNNYYYGKIPYQIKMNTKYYIAVGIEKPGDCVKFVE